MFICSYKAGCLGFTLYHQLTDHNVKCIVMAPTTLLKPPERKKVKTDKRDAALLARCLAHHDYCAVHIPTDKDEQVKEYIRMRSDHKLALKKLKQQILSFCLRHNYRFAETNHHWTQAHLRWLRALKPGGIYQEILEEYLITFDHLSAKIERLDKRIEELSSDQDYRNNVKKLSCFLAYMHYVEAKGILSAKGGMYIEAVRMAVFIVTAGADVTISHMTSKILR